MGLLNECYRSLIAETRARLSSAAVINPPRIYIKAHSRPAYLERCLRTILKYLTGFSEIVILNDGIAPELLTRLVFDPRIRVVHSLKVARGILAMPASPQLQDIEVMKSAELDPSKFWVSELRTDPNPFGLILEEDFWATHPVNLYAIACVMAAKRGLLVNLRSYRQPYEALSGYFGKIKWALRCDGSLLEEVDYSACEIPDGNLVSVGCGLVFLPYLVAYMSNLSDWKDESEMHRRSLAIVNQFAAEGRPVSFFQVGEGGVFRHCISSSTQPDVVQLADGAKLLFDPYVFNVGLTAAWAESELEVLEGFPGDFSDAYLLNKLPPYLPPECLAQWLAFRKHFASRFPTYA